MFSELGWNWLCTVSSSKKLSSGHSTQGGDYSSVDNTPIKISFHLVKDRILFGRKKRRLDSPGNATTDDAESETYVMTAYNMLQKAQSADKVFKNSKVTVNFTSS